MNGESRRRCGAVLRGVILLALTMTGVGLGNPRPPILAHASDASSVQKVNMTWLRIDPADPRTLYIGGHLQCTGDCSDWLFRSSDGGATWTDLSLPLYQVEGRGIVRVTQVRLGQDGRHLYVEAHWDLGGSAGHYEGVLASIDEGLHWTAGVVVDGMAGAFVVSPLASTRLYGIAQWGIAFQLPNRQLTAVIQSADEGHHWQAGGDPMLLIHAGDYPIFTPWGRLVPSPIHVATLFADINAAMTYETTAKRQAVARSTDGGRHWSLVVTPPLRSFQVSFDSHYGALLVGQTTDPRVPADRRYVSPDEGRTWAVTTCPGDLHGACPAFTVENVFDPGASYGFYDTGIYRFHGRGPALSPVRLGATAPFHSRDLIDVAAGPHAGDPIYVLVRANRGRVHGLVYRSRDAGKSWQLLAMPALARISAPFFLLP